MRRCLPVASLVAGVVLAQTIASGQGASKSLPYTAIHDPEFIAAADAAFISGEDRVIGLMSGDTPKAYPGAILSQHGLVEDQSPKGPIAITW